MLKKFGMNDYKPLPTPIAHDELLCKNDGRSKVDETAYKNTVRNLIFLTNSRIDIAHVV